MKQILIPTDFSDNSWNAILYGLELFGKSECTFHLLHINAIPSYSGAASSISTSSKLMQDAILKQSREALQELLVRIKKLPNNASHDFTLTAVYDFFVDAIKRQVEEKDIDMILMGTKGATGLKKVTMGSNTGDVITKVKCPLLAVPEDARFKQPKEIAFPTDYYNGYDLKVLDTLIAIASVSNAVLRILHISKKGEELTEGQKANKDFLHNYLGDLEHTFHFVRGTKLETAVQCFADSRDIDMVAMVAKNLNFFQRILFRPAVEEISYHTEIPFLVLHG
ncbi:universal stress protein [Spongiimicrobium sp. 3-5]|uniref:universal stress protein n=1 Tax=Spongiimicrobium sp. 3-5 TaxID=3332596 RepID=UPI00397EB780